MQDLTARENTDKLGSSLDRGGRHIFEFESHDIDALGKRPNLVKVVVRTYRLNVGDLSSRRVAFWRKRMHAIAHLAGLDRKHPSELAAAENTDS